MVFGEYAVLEGAPALVLATPQRAYATFEAASPEGLQPGWHLAATNLGLHGVVPSAPGDALNLSDIPKPLHWAATLVQAVWAEAKGALPEGTLSLNTQAFYCGGTKLGLGSSAAIFVASYLALRAAAKLAEPPPMQVLTTLRRLHSAAQGGQGSGVDLAASLLGGLVRYQLATASAEEKALEQDSADTEIKIFATPVAPAQGLHLLPVWTGRAAQTGPYLSRFAELRESDPAAFWPVCEEMALVARAACELWAMQAVPALMPLIPRSVQALHSLQNLLQLPILTAEHTAAAQASTQAGAAYKPSGAGGGDFGLIFADTARALARARKALMAQGMTPMPMAMDAIGATCEVHPCR